MRQEVTVFPRRPPGAAHRGILADPPDTLVLYYLRNRQDFHELRKPDEEQA